MHRRQEVVSDLIEIRDELHVERHDVVDTLVGSNGTDYLDVPSRPTAERNGRAASENILSARRARRRGPWNDR